MNTAQLKLIRCPYCCSAFTVNHIFTQQQNSITLGSAYCTCEEFPIINDILYLHKQRASYILDRLRKNNYTGALSIALDSPRSMMPLAHIFNLPLPDLASGKQSAISEFKLRWFWKHIFHQPIEDFDYYIHRNRSAPSLLAFFPLGYISKNKNSTWLDVGPGIFTHYASIQKDFPRITFISIETTFLYQYLSTILFPSQNTVRICADAACGSFVKPQSVDVTTYLDSLYCIPQQRASIQTTTKHDLKKDGFAFASSLFEHAYFPLKRTPYYPISRSLLSQFAGSSVVYFDNEKLSTCMKNQSHHISDAVIRNGDSFFRYCALWPAPVFRNTWSYSVHKKITNQSKHLMTKPDIIWHNAIY